MIDDPPPRLSPTPTIFIDYQSGSNAATVVNYIITFVVYLGLAFIATFFNVFVVYTTKVRFAGGDATFGESLKFAFSRIHLIFMWSLVSATVGMILRGIDAAAQRAGGAAQVIIQFLVSLLGMAWSVVSLFVIPVMVYEGVGPVDALKRSVDTLKKTWGESLIRHFGLGIFQFIGFLLGIGLAFVLFATLGSLGQAGAIIAFAIVLVYFVALIIVFTLANTIFNTALYEFAATGRVPGTEFSAEEFQGAFSPRGR